MDNEAFMDEVCDYVSYVKGIQIVPTVGESRLSSCTLCSWMDQYGVWSMLQYTVCGKAWMS